MAQTITVTAVDDAIAQGEHQSIITHTVTSTDLAYDGLAADSLTVTIGDDDTAGIEVDPTALTVAEPDGSDFFTVKLTSQPTATVTIDLTTSNSECSLSEAQVAQDDNNWDVGVEVTVTAEDDTSADGDQELYRDRWRPPAPGPCLRGWTR